MKSYYDNQLEIQTQIALKQKKKVNSYSLWRLIIFILIIVFTSIALLDQKRYLLIVALILLITFLYLLKKHNSALNEQQKTKAKMQVIKQYLDRFDYKWQTFPETGIEYLNDNDFIATDLNLLGTNSLFQYLNLAKSKPGKAKLAQRFCQQENHSSDNKYISALAQDQDLHLELTTLIQLYNNKNQDLDFSEEPILSNKLFILYDFITKILAPISLIMYLLIIFNFINVKYLSLLILINLIIFLVGLKKNNSILKYSNLNSNINVLTDIIICLENNKDHLIHQKFPNLQSKALKELIGINERIRSGANVLMYFLANITIMWDYQNVYSYEKFKRNNHQDLSNYPEVLYELEVLLSLGIIQQTKNNCCSPNIRTSKQPKLDFKGIYHPLLDDNVVANDFATDNGIIMITGSNMSGKTTFMRSVGINLILAYSGAMVCADTMEITFMKLLTSIRVQDDLNEGISSFYAEIKRIKQMIEYTKLTEPALFLIDEIFKGTNSDDRIYGAEKVIDNLNKGWIIALISTHDSELTLLKVENYHFKEYYDKNEIKFDYLINHGPAKTRNAKYLLQMAGII